MSCTPGEYKGQGYLACGPDKLGPEDQKAIEEYIDFRKERGEKIRAKDKQAQLNKIDKLLSKLLVTIASDIENNLKKKRDITEYKNLGVLIRQIQLGFTGSQPAPDYRQVEPMPLERVEKLLTLTFDDLKYFLQRIARDQGGLTMEEYFKCIDEFQAKGNIYILFEKAKHNETK